MSPTPRSTAELQELLRAVRGPVRLLGTGSRQARLPAADGATALSLAGLDRIRRLDAPDQTCSVEPGVRREVLDAELARVGLELPCAGGGSLGGLFASDATGPVTVGGASPRSLLLGLEALLADGTSFRSGARVVKSVAGFDVHKLLVGSQGRLFAATQLHLRLRPRPRSEAWFERARLERDDALRLLATLRALAPAPAALHLLRGPHGFSLAGRLAGRAVHVQATLREHALREHALREGPALASLHLEATAGGEVVAGNVVGSRLPALLAAIPADARFLMHGGGRFEVALASARETDALLAALPALSTQACIVLGEPARRGRGTPLDAGHERLASGLKQTLDPHGIFV
ncbi:MAG TPA: FAD-binding oxidoreductase [Planctomycetota bacterium]|nr:FAD-binding oxidoreductase [Planctomycetota bacterium]